MIGKIHSKQKYKNRNSLGTYNIVKYRKIYWTLKERLHTSKTKKDVLNLRKQQHSKQPARLETNRAGKQL